MTAAAATVTLLVIIKMMSTADTAGPNAERVNSFLTRIFRAVSTDLPLLPGPTPAKAAVIPGVPSV